MLVQGLVALLNQTGNVTAICNGNIAPIPAPSSLDALPCVTYQTVSDVQQYVITDPTWTRVSESRIAFNCIAEDYGNARTLAEEIKIALSGFRGTLPDGTPVLMTKIVNMVDGFDSGSRISTTTVHAMLTYLN